MKKLASLLAAATVAAPAFAGDVVYVEQNTYAPAPQPELLQWFVGGSAGYLVDTDEAFYSFHLGREVGQFGGWTTSVFLEGAFFEIDGEGILGPDDQLDDDGNPLNGGLETQTVPVTLNVKFERELTSWLDFYVGAGAGVAFVTADAGFEDEISSAGDTLDAFENSETVFYGQVFAGLEFEIGQHFEIFTGARYIYVDDYDIDIDGTERDIDDQDDVLVELGGRFKF